MKTEYIVSKLDELVNWARKGFFMAYDFWFSLLCC